MPRCSAFLALSTHSVEEREVARPVRLAISITRTAAQLRYHLLQMRRHLCLPMKQKSPPIVLGRIGGSCVCSCVCDVLMCA